MDVRLFRTDCRYDGTFGRDLLNDMGLTLDFAKKTMKWDECLVPMRSFPTSITNKHGIKDPSPAEQLYLNALEADLEDDDTLPTCDLTDCDIMSLNDEFDDSDMGNDQAVDTDLYNQDKTINISKCNAADVDEVVCSCTHLSQVQQNKLREVLSRYPVLFNNELGAYPDEKIHLDLKPDAVPHCQPRAYAVPHTHRPIFEAELDRLVKIGVLEEGTRSEWIAGTFIIPKKLLPGETVPRVRWISDFRGLNKHLKRRVCPVPRIADTLSRRTGYHFLSKLDISMQFYTFELDDESAELCTIATPFGLYRYRKLPMGVCQSPDIAQEVMEKTSRDISDNLEVYIDDIAVFSDNFDDHLAVLDKVCQRLQDKGFSVNPLKCEWAVKESDFLGQWLTPAGVKPLRKKIQGIVDMTEPTNVSQLRSFLGVVTYYRDMWPKRSHILAPLTELLGTKTFIWDAPQREAFRKMKAIITKDTLLAYPDHNRKFKLDTDASDYQLGGRIYQDFDHPTKKNPDGTPFQVERDIGFYARKLNSAQKNYSAIEKELLSIVEILKQFRSTLLGAEIEVCTDHKNLTYKLSQFATQRVMRWRLLLEEYGAKFLYKSGPVNVVADALSRVPSKRVERESQEQPILNISDDPELAECLFHDPEVSDCFLEHPVFDEDGRVPFQFPSLQHYQEKSAELQSMPQVFPDRFVVKQFNDSQLTCFRQNDADRIVLTQELLPKVIKFYHESMAHAEGSGRLSKTIKQHFYHGDIDDACKQHVQSCDACAVMRRGGRMHGESAPRDASVMPWQEAHCDSIGPWKIELRARELTFHAMTMIDAGANLVEIKHAISTTAKEGARLWKTLGYLDVQDHSASLLIKDPNSAKNSLTCANRTELHIPRLLHAIPKAIRSLNGHIRQSDKCCEQSPSLAIRNLCTKQTLQSKKHLRQPCIHAVPPVVPPWNAIPQVPCRLVVTCSSTFLS